MISKEAGNLVFLAVAVAIFWYGSNLGEKPDAKAAETSAQSAPAVAAQPATPTPPAQPSAAVVPAQPQPVAKPTPAAQPVAQPTPAKPKAAKPKAAPVAKPAPKPVAKPTPKPSPKPAVVSGPRPIVDNPDDSPGRTADRKVKPGTETHLPPAYGPTDAKTLVLIFSDFQCPVCRRAADATHQIAEEFPGEVRLEFWQHALKMHRNAEAAAMGSMAAHMQGKFWEYHDKLFRNQAALDNASLRQYAVQLGLDMTKWDKDFQDETLRARVKKEGDFADALGARGTPAFMVNGKLSVGWGSWNGFRGQVAREVNVAKATTGSPAEVRESRAKENLTDPEHFQLYLNTALQQLAAAKK